MLDALVAERLAAKSCHRVCGGNVEFNGHAGLFHPLPPRVRGKPHAIRFGVMRRAAATACAGETPGIIGRCCLYLGCPRVCGGNASPGLQSGNTMGCPRVCGGNRNLPILVSDLQQLPPRVRGKPGVGLRLGRSWGAAPACAGETVRNRPRGFRGGGCPRVCGGNRQIPPPGRSRSALPPRVRGKPVQPEMPKKTVGAAPACAGETVRPALPWHKGKGCPRVCGGNR